jgi:hypothetical protein
MFHPIDSTWAVVDSLGKARTYHSFALLLPDARLFCAGNEPSWNLGPEEDEQDYEIYYPPYLFAGSDWATRPDITACDSNIHHGLPFFVTTLAAANVDSVVVMRPGSVTHAYDHTQRRVLLEFTKVDDTTLAVTAPWTPEVAPPGDYMVFLLDNGVPSTGTFVNLKEATSTAITGQHTVWDGTVRLSKSFTVDAGDTLEIRPGTRSW